MGLSLQAASFQQPVGVPGNAAVFTSLHFRSGKYLPRCLKACFRRIFAGLGLKVPEKADFCTGISGAGSLTDRKFAQGKSSGLVKLEHFCPSVEC